MNKNPIQIACYALLASAFVLAGLLTVQLQNRSVLAQAHASQVVTRNNLTVMTARTQSGEESLFVLDNISQSLLIYRVDLARRGGTIELLKAIALDDPTLFGAGKKDTPPKKKP